MIDCLDKAPAVITLDIQTNANGTAWVSIGGENIQNVSGDVWKKVEAGARTISWRPDLSWPDHKIADGGARAVVTAWSIDNPPDYMVVNIAANATPNSETYYPAVEFLPGGLLKNQDYRTSKLVMRKIPAKGVEWTMGSAAGEYGHVSAREAMHTVTLTNNFYIAVFETTQTQWSLIPTANQTPSGIDANLTRLGRYFYNGGQKGYTATVGSYAPNSWGLYDMNGNVWEWCLDWFKEDISDMDGAVTIVEGAGHVRRGGCWNYAASSCRAALRGSFGPDSRTNETGFRLALPASPALTAE